MFSYCTGFNTASGMDCMQFELKKFSKGHFEGFNTASGMDCMQFHNVYGKTDALKVSIPQAVWIACNV